MQLKFFGEARSNLRPEADGILDEWYRFLGTCSVEFFNAMASYDPRTDSFDVLAEETTKPETVTTLFLPLLAQYATDCLANMQGSIPSLGKNETDQAAALFNQEMGRLAAASTGGFYMTAPAHSATEVSQAVLGAYPVPANFIVVGILYTYGAFAIFIFVSSASASSYCIAASPNNGTSPSLPIEKQALVLGQTWLTNSLPLLGFAFPEKDPTSQQQRSIAQNPLDMINDVYEERLVLGIHHTGTGTAFGVQRWNWMNVQRGMMREGA